jgi:hypothetical protein
MDELELNLPSQAEVNKLLPKKKFYEKLSISKKLKDEFVNKIQKIIWKYKLSEDSINIEKTASVIEIQIFYVELKEQIIPKSVLRMIDKSIPYPILYKFIYKNNFAYGISLMHSDLGSDYYFSNWNTNIGFSFNALNLEKLYEKLIKAFIHDDIKQDRDFKAIVSIDQKIKELEREIENLSLKIKREKQFNKKVELNKILLKVKSELETIRGSGLV